MGMNKVKQLVSFGSEEHEYTVNGVRYIVSSRFEPIQVRDKTPTLTDRIGEHLENAIADLIKNDDECILDDECVSAAGKED